MRSTPRVHSIALAGAGLVLTFLSACASQPNRAPAVQEVPIGTEVGNSPEIPDAVANDPSMPDTTYAGDAGASPDEPVTPDAPSISKKHRGAHESKPTAITGSSAGSSSEGQPAGSDRAALETKVFGGHASRAETLTLVKLCTKEKDRECLQKIGTLMRKR